MKKEFEVNLHQGNTVYILLYKSTLKQGEPEQIQSETFDPYVLAISQTGVQIWEF